MLKREAIVSIFERHNIGLYETEYSLDEEFDIVLKTKDVDVLIQLMKDNSIPSAFYSYSYVDEEDYWITDSDLHELETYSDFGDEIVEKWYSDIQKKADEFNKKISDESFSMATMLSCFCILNGVQVGVVQKDDWVDRIPSKEKFLLDLSLRYEGILLKEKQKKFEQDQIDEETNLKKIVEYIESTDEWHSRTNKRLRQLYCAELKEKFLKEQGIDINYYALYDKFEIIWMNYKQSKMKK